MFCHVLLHLCSLAPINMECGIRHVFFHVNMPNKVGVWHHHCWCDSGLYSSYGVSDLCFAHPLVLPGPVSVVLMPNRHLFQAIEVECYVSRLCFDPHLLMRIWSFALVSICELSSINSPCPHRSGSRLSSCIGNCCSYHFCYGSVE